ncbi:MAG: PTS transporter subunit EIIB [Atopobiaceae bacterium]|nr:PTS transporter subunit EIIB [Atopobiaceae bacterium]
MAVDYNATTDEVIRLVGGKDNIKNVTHCVTRLRFTLKDNGVASANADDIAALDGVIKVLEACGQVQVVIGTQVEEAYDLVVEKTGLAGGVVDVPDAAAEDANKTLVDKLMNTM